MKKLLLMLLVFTVGIFATGCKGEDIKNQMPEPIVQSMSGDAWTSTFQLCWNEFIKLVGTEKIEYVKGNPPLADELNKQLFTKNDLSEDSYYISVTKQTLKHKTEIQNAIKAKFNETSDILDKFDFADIADNKTNKWFIYSMLIKNFEFIKPYSVLNSQTFNGVEGQKYKFFGYTSNYDDKENQQLRENYTESLFYANDEDFAVKFLDKNQKEEMILYLTSSNESFDRIYLDMLDKCTKKEEYKQNRIKAIDPTLLGSENVKFKNLYKIPFIHIDENLDFDKELANKDIKDRTYDITGFSWVILKTLQTVKFDLDSEGAKLKSEAGMSVAMKTSLEPVRDIEINNLYYFDRPFVIFLKERGKDKPYFAARIKDGKYLVKENL